MNDIKTEALRTVSRAINLDCEGLYEAAYQTYLEGIIKLGSFINQSYGYLDQSTKSKRDTLKILSLIKESTERLIKLVTEIDITDVTDQNATTGNAPNLTKFGGSYQEGQSLAVDPISVSKPLLSPGRPRIEFSPIEKAKRFNAILYKQYQRRCEHVKDSTQKASLQLELHRRLSENIIAARAKEAEIRQGQIEKEREILKLAANVSSHPLSLWMCKSQLQLLDRMQSILFENQHIQNLLPRTLSFPGPDGPSPISENSKRNENGLSTKTFNSIRLSTPEAVPSLTTISTTMPSISESNYEKSSTENSNLISSVIPLNKMWLESDDVLTLFDPLAVDNGQDCPFAGYISSGIDALTTNSIMTYLESIVSDTIDSVETLVQMLCATFELESDECQDVCYHVVENYFFQPIWSHLIQLFRVADFESEKALNESITKFDSDAEEFGVPSFYQIESCQSEISARLQRVIALNTPLAKLRQLVVIARTLCSPTYCAGKSLGADDLIGIMCFLLLKSGIPQLNAEFEAIEQLVPHRYLMGEEGYALTTHRTAVKYLISQRNVVK